MFHVSCRPPKHLRRVSGHDRSRRTKRRDSSGSWIPLSGRWWECLRTPEYARSPSPLWSMDNGSVHIRPMSEKQLSGYCCAPLHFVPPRSLPPLSIAFCLGSEKLRIPLIPTQDLEALALQLRPRWAFQSFFSHSPCFGELELSFFSWSREVLLLFAFFWPLCSRVGGIEIEMFSCYNCNGCGFLGCTGGGFWCKDVFLRVSAVAMLLCCCCCFRSCDWAGCFFDV